MVYDVLGWKDMKIRKLDFKAYSVKFLNSQTN